MKHEIPISEMKCKLLWIIKKSENLQHIVKRKKLLQLAKYMEKQFAKTRSEQNSAFISLQYSEIFLYGILK